MLFVGSISVTLLTMAYLEKRGKISLNHNILYLLILILAVWVGVWGMGEIDKTFLLNITR